jgi:hypothetical protein
MLDSIEPKKKNPEFGSQLITNFVAAECSLLVGNLIVRVCYREELLPTWLIIALAIATVIPMLFFAIKFFRMLRDDLDEMLQRIVLEGLAFALVVFIPLAGFYVNARAAGLLGTKLDPPELLLVPSILVAVGVLISWSRHK